MKLKKSTLALGAVAILGVAGCSTLYDLVNFIPGSDRIFFQNSKAEVGPVLTKTGDVLVAESEEGENAGTPAEQEAVVADTQAPETPKVTPEVKPTVEPEPEPAKPEPIQQPVAKAPPKPVAAAPKVTAPKVATAPEPIKTPVVVSDRSVSGKVTLMGRRQREISPEGVIVRLHRVDGETLTAASSSTTHVIDMKDKIYQPGQMVIKAGDTVRFLNSDDLRHNVFSSTGANAFDLGTYGGGLQRGVTLNKDGVAKIYCNIHPDMVTFIAIDELGISQVLGEDGAFEFKNLPPADYRITLWSVRGEYTQEFSLKDQIQTVLDISFDTSEYREKQQKNKFGRRYQPPRQQQTDFF